MLGKVVGWVILCVSFLVFSIYMSNKRAKKLNLMQIFFQKKAVCLLSGVCKCVIVICLWRL